MKRFKIYLAGPNVFRPNSKKIFSYMKETLEREGFIPLCPLDNEIRPPCNPDQIYNGNVKMLDECDGVLANLDPFRGPSADVGTVWEMAYALGLGKRVIGYRTATTKYIERCPEDGMFREDFDLGDNLMIDCSVPIKTCFPAAAIAMRRKFFGE